MIEKIGIRIVLSFVVLWYVISKNLFTIPEVEMLFAVTMFYACLSSLMIETSIILLRNYIKKITTISIIMIFIIVACFYVCGWGIYFGIASYLLVSIWIDLYREFKMYKLLQNALRSHSDE